MAHAGTSPRRVALASFALFCFSLFITAYGAKNPEINHIGAAVVSEILRPFQSSVESGFESVTGFLDQYVMLTGIREENLKLEKRLKALEDENFRLREFEHENKRLASLLHFVGEQRLEGIGAKIIGYDPSNWIEAVTIDKGSTDGIYNGMAVVDGVGVVGRIVETGFSTARLLLLSDNVSGIDSLIQESRARGVVTGKGNGKCRLEYVSRDYEVKIGDTVITSGMDGIFPKGLLIGVVSYIDKDTGSLFQEMDVTPSVQLSRLEYVFVVSKILPEPKPPAQEKPKK